MKFCVLGMGFVGQAIYSVLDEKHDVDYVDPHRFMAVPGSSFATFDAMAAQNPGVDGFVICVPTPEEDGNGRCDDTLVSEYVDTIQQHYPKAHILIKSTTSVDTLSRFTGNVTFSPEFLRGSVGADPTQEFRDTGFAIFGGNDGRWWYEVFRQLVTINEVRFLDIESAGFLKYSENAFLAMKVMFFNELEHLYSNTIDKNFDGMIEALALDERIGMSHTQVPGPDGQYGFGGHCLPKDTAEFTEWASECHSKLHLLELARKLNFTTYRNK